MIIITDAEKTFGKIKPQFLRKMLSGKDVKKLEPLYSVGRNVKMVEPLCETVWWFLKKTKNGIPI